MSHMETFGAGTGSGAAQPPAESRCVLLVDDDTAVRTFAARALSNRGYRVIQCDSGDTALGVLDAGHAVDVVVTDIVMPGLDGLALARCIGDRWPHLPVILMTGYADAARRSELEATHHTALLMKPFRLHTLCDSVAEHLGEPAPG